MKVEKINILGWSLILLFATVVLAAGYISYKSIDYQVLEKMESQVLVLPTPAVSNLNPLPANPSPSN